MNRRLHRRGSSLLEILVVLTVLGIALQVGAVLLITAMRLDQMSAETIHRITRQRQLADLFRADVAQAEAAPATWNTYQAGDQCLILRQPGDHWVVYQAQGDGIQQIVSSSDGETHRPIMPGPKEGDIRFQREGGVVILQITERTKGLTGQQWEIRAGLGGDLP